MSAYYNEFDPKAAAWLRELITAGLIADGEVDERSILEVQPDELRGFTQCHFFAGIGGWSLALRYAGWSDDVPVWTGSPPCQPFSVSGKGLGADDERHLAPHFVSLVRACRPKVLFGEQVASAAVLGKVSKASKRSTGKEPDWAWFDDLSDRLEASQYTVGAGDIPAASIGTPNIRQRTFFGAFDSRLAALGLGLSNSLRWPERWNWNNGGHDGAEPGAASSDNGLVNGVSEGLEGHGGDGRDGDKSGRLDTPQAGSVGATGAVGGVDDSASGNTSPEREQSSGEFGLQPIGGFSPSKFINAGASQDFWSDADWLLCRDGKWRPVESGTFPLAHGVSHRVGLLRGYGNAINPWAAKIFIETFCELAA